MKTILNCLLSVALFASISNPIHATSTTIIDGEFNNGDWNSFLAFDSHPLLTQSFTTFQQLSGGNPDAFRQMNQKHGSNSTISIFHYRNTPLYNPSVDGELTSIDYQADVIGLGGCCAFTDGFILAQSGSWFFASSSAAQFSSNTGGWQATGITGLLPSDFSQLSGGALLPDFSASGGEMWFGYFRNTTVPFIFSGTTHGIDNWQVQLNSPVPVPAAVWLFGSGLIGLIVMRKKTNQKPQ